MLDVRDSGRDSGNFLNIDEINKVAEMPLPQPKLLSPIPSRYLAKKQKNSVSLVANYKKTIEDRVSKLRANRDLENL